MPDKKGSSEKLSKLYVPVYILYEERIAPWTTDLLALPTDSIWSVRVKPNTKIDDSLVECYK